MDVSVKFEDFREFQIFDIHINFLRVTSQCPPTSEELIYNHQNLKRLRIEDPHTLSFDECANYKELCIEICREVLAPESGNSLEKHPCIL